MKIILYNLLMIMTILFIGCEKTEYSAKNSFDISRPYDIANIKSGTKLEFIQYPINIDAHMDTITIIFLDNNKAEVNYWHKGYPNNVINNERLIYYYKIDNSYNLEIEYKWEGVDEKVIILQNENAGWSNRKIFLEKKFMLSNAFNKEENSKFLGFRIFKQIDGGGTFLNAGDLNSVR